MVTNLNRGISFSIEGSEGAGKTVLSMLTRELLKETTSFPVMATREPGGTPLAEEIRKLLKNAKFSDMEPRTNVLLFNAGRSEVFSKLEIPFLEKNPYGVLLKDRSRLSTIALQEAEGADIGYIKSIQEPFISIPDRFLIIDIPVKETIVRMTAAQKNGGNREVDWRDHHRVEILEKIRENYLSFAVQNRDMCIVLDCFDDPWDKAARIKSEVFKMFAEREGKVFEPNELGSLQKTFSLDAQRIALNNKTWIPTLKREVPLVDIHELREIVEFARKELNYPSREELQREMHEKWQFMGIEGFSGGIERR